MSLKENWINKFALTHVEETKWNDIWESRTGHIFIFSKVDDDVRVKRKRVSRRSEPEQGFKNLNIEEDETD